MAVQQKQLLQNDDEEVIDLRELFFALKKRLLILILAGILGGGIGYAYTKIVLTPTYTSTSMIFIMAKETTITSLTDLQIGTQLTNDYAVLIKSRTVMENTIQKLGLPVDYLELRNRVRVSNPDGTRILNISVTDADKQMAKTLADEVASAASDYIATIMEQAPPKIIEQGEMPLHQTSPNTRKNTMLGMLAGVMLVAACICLSVILNDTVQTEDDIERVTGVPVLAVVPSSSGMTSKRRNKRQSKRGGRA